MLNELNKITQSYLHYTRRFLNSKEDDDYNSRKYLPDKEGSKVDSIGDTFTEVNKVSL